MDRNDRVILKALVKAVTLAVASVLLVWAILAGAFAVPPDAGWIYHYQTLIAGVALAAALITVRVMRQQIDIGRADEADRALTHYASAIMDVMQKHEAATPPDQNETIDDAKLRLEDLRAATDDPTMRTAMMDNLFGLDQPMVASFVNSCRFSAVGRVYGRDDYVCHTNMIWPLYFALSNGINHRRALLRAGAGVSTLYTLSTINHAECRSAFVENRTPVLDELDQSKKRTRA